MCIRDSIKPRDVIVPGILIDYVFVSKPEYHWQTSKTYYNPVFSGEIRVPLDAIPFEKLSARKLIARRAAMELTKGAIVNLGVGIPEAVSSVAAEEGCGDYITLTTEAGGIGGVPASSHDFGCCWNAEATIEMADEFDMYDGGALDLGLSLIHIFSTEESHRRPIRLIGCLSDIESERRERDMLLDIDVYKRQGGYSASQTFPAATEYIWEKRYRLTSGNSASRP